MTWSIDDVEKTLLGQNASVLALPPDVIVDAVNRVEKVLGHDWILAEARATGIAPAMGIIGMGLRLAALDDLVNTETLVSNLRQEDQNAEAELTALYLIRRRNSSLEVELEPAVGTRKADFRVRRAGESLWTTVEVTQATTSEYQQHLLDILEKILEALRESKSRFSLNVIFRREPTEAEITFLRSELPQFCVQPGQQQATLPGELGFMLLNHAPISQGQKIEIAGLGPTIGIMMFVGGGPGGGPNHKVSVQIPFTDERAEEILRKEAKQLPKDGIGLVMINASGGAGRFQVWTSLISQRFQRKIHTRVSGVCLFEGSMVPNGPQYDWLVQTKLVVNDHSQFQLPSWIQTTFNEAGEEFERALLKAGPAHPIG
ncbi:MAG: hypothetical protein LAO56_19530 [Acidobacteriia bacterium]|nr:hypothetical protein [Terriglobia bacterium]